MVVIPALIAKHSYPVKYPSQYTLILCCAGKSQRYGKEKLLEIIHDKYLYEYSLNTFFVDPDCVNIILVIPKRWHIGIILEHLKKANLRIVYGGKTRTESIKIALKHVHTKYVMIHDGARPCVTRKLINDLKRLMLEIKITNKKCGIVPYEKVDSLLVKNKEQIKTGEYILVQTPQFYKREEIQEVYASLTSYHYRDTSSLYLERKEFILYHENKEINMKITQPHDLDKYRGCFLKNNSK